MSTLKNLTFLAYREVPTIRNPAELARVMQEKKELEAQHRQLIEEHGQLRYKYVSSVP